MSSISSGSRPTRKGSRYCSTAVTTASGRCVNVAQPSPYRPGSLVSTLTTTSRIPSGAVQIALTRVIRRGDIAAGGYSTIPHRKRRQSGDGRPAGEGPARLVPHPARSGESRGWGELWHFAG